MKDPETWMNCDTSNNALAAYWMEEIDSSLTITDGHLLLTDKRGKNGFLIKKVVLIDEKTLLVGMSALLIDLAGCLPRFPVF